MCAWQGLSASVLPVVQMVNGNSLEHANLTAFSHSSRSQVYAFILPYIAVFNF